MKLSIATIAGTLALSKAFVVPPYFFSPPYVPSTTTPTSTFVPTTISFPPFYAATAKPTLPARAAAVGNLWPSGAGGALDPDPILTIATTAIAKPPGSITVKLVNKAGVDLSSSVQHNVGASPFATGDPANGVFPKGATATMVAPTGWAGQIAFNQAKRSIKADEGVVEGSFVVQANTVDYALLDIDVSFVNGYTMPIMCYCGGSDGAVLSGCNKNLWNLGTCPDDLYNGAGSCKNPRRDQPKNSMSIPFLQPCAGLAYTYVEDHAANSNGECQSGTVTCEILAGFHP